MAAVAAAWPRHSWPRRRLPSATGRAREPGARIDDVVDRLPALLPLPAGHRRGGQAARRQPDNLARWPAAWVACRPAGGVRERPAAWIARVCGGHRPAAARRQPGDGDVASQADQDAPLPAGPACRRDRAVRSESLGRRAEIQDDPGGQPQRGAVQRHRSPARHRTGPGRRRWRAGTGRLLRAAGRLVRVAGRFLPAWVVVAGPGVADPSDCSWPERDVNRAGRRSAGQPAAFQRAYGRGGRPGLSRMRPRR